MIHRLIILLLIVGCDYAPTEHTHSTSVDADWILIKSSNIRFNHPDYEDVYGIGYVLFITNSAQFTVDENILTSPNIINSGRLIDTLIRNKIVERDINIDELLECDKEAILVFLRNTAYGPEYDINLIDPQTKKEFQAVVDLSALDFK